MFLAGGNVPDWGHKTWDSSFFLGQTVFHWIWYNTKWKSFKANHHANGTCAKEPHSRFMQWFKCCKSESVWNMDKQYLWALHFVVVHETFKAVADSGFHPGVGWENAHEACKNFTHPQTSRPPWQGGGQISQGGGRNEKKNIRLLNDLTVWKEMFFIQYRTLKNPLG